MALGALETAALERAVLSPSLAQQIASSLAGGDPAVTANTAITTVGAGTLTAAAIVGGIITRSGSIAAYTDTTATAALIYAAAPTAVNQSWTVTIKNTVAFPQTITGGSGVTVSGISIVPALSATTFLFTLSGTATATMVGLYSAPLTVMTPSVNTTISTVGAGTLTAAGITGGLITRSGSTAAYTDTTATAAQIIAAMPNANVGDAFEFSIKNTVAFAETLAAASGVTLSGLSVVPPLSVGRFLCVVTAASTVTITGIETSPLCNLPYSKFTSSSASNATATAGDITGASFVNLTLTANGANAYTTRTGAEMFGDIPNCQIGTNYMLRIRNTGDDTVTLTAGSNVTLTGTMTIATTTARLFNVSFTSATAATIQDLGVN